MSADKDVFQRFSATSGSVREVDWQVQINLSTRCPMDWVCSKNAYQGKGASRQGIALKKKRRTSHSAILKTPRQPVPSSVALSLACALSRLIKEAGIKAERNLGM
jgi:hypothetical protein